MSGNGKYSADEVIAQVEKAKGLISVAARNLGCSRSTLYRYIENYATVAQAVRDARENMTDFAEGKLYEKISGGDTASIIFYLKTQGKRRGYVERHEVTGKDGESLNFVMSFGDKLAND